MLPDISVWIQQRLLKWPIWKKVAARSGNHLQTHSTTPSARLCRMKWQVDKLVLNGPFKWAIKCISSCNHMCRPPSHLDPIKSWLSDFYRRFVRWLIVCNCQLRHIYPPDLPCLAALSRWLQHWFASASIGSLLMNDMSRWFIGFPGAYHLVQLRSIIGHLGRCWGIKDDVSGHACLDASGVRRRVDC